jgi:hypothetical protein
LSALDAKIELNNRINAELEGMAKLLYDYWFVQFDFPMTVPRRDNREESRALDFTIIAGELGRGTVGL